MCALLGALAGAQSVALWAQRRYLDAAKFMMSALELAAELLQGLLLAALVLTLRILLWLAWLAHIFGAAFGGLLDMLGFGLSQGGSR